ncbi:hypothetical protein ACIQ2D_12990 [Lysinibacillus sp. NPDC097287]|uniref:hypothetical protein n=1 Tax=Lysinibacillus sp. NPDC097287 TaxID=3364144 RepID=UPI003804D431
MKKYVITLLIVLVFLANPESSKAELQWDGAQVVKGQTGKMTFTKDVKVYKKNANGTYSSMTVKHNNYFRVYNIEKYDNKTFYWMSSGYRVQATDLVVFKKIPLDIRASLYDNPGYININRQDQSYGSHYIAGVVYHNISIRENLFYSDYNETGDSIDHSIDGADIRIVETTKRDEGLYMLTADAQELYGPMNGAKGSRKNSKGTAFPSLGIEINGYLMVGSGLYYPVTLLEPVKKQGKRYIRYGVIAEVNGSQKELKRFDEGVLLTENDTTAWIEIDGEVYSVPKQALATIRPNESPIITTSFLPNDTLQQLDYGAGVYKRTANNRFEAQNVNKFIDYYETEKTFNYEKDGIKYVFEKPVTEGSRMTRKFSDSIEEGFIRAIHYTYTTEAGTFSNVVETPFGDIFAPGYGFIRGLTSYEK